MLGVNGTPISSLSLECELKKREIATKLEHLSRRQAAREAAAGKPGVGSKQQLTQRLKQLQRTKNGSDGGVGRADMNEGFESSQEESKGSNPGPIHPSDRRSLEWDERLRQAKAKYWSNLDQMAPDWKANAQQRRIEQLAKYENAIDALLARRQSASLVYAKERELQKLLDAKQLELANLAAHEREEVRARQVARGLPAPPQHGVGAGQYAQTPQSAYGSPQRPASAYAQSRNSNYHQSPHPQQSPYQQHQSPHPSMHQSHYHPSLHASQRHLSPAPSHSYATSHVHHNLNVDYAPYVPPSHPPNSGYGGVPSHVSPARSVAGPPFGRSHSLSVLPTVADLEDESRASRLAATTREVADLDTWRSEMEAEERLRASRREEREIQEMRQRKLDLDRRRAQEAENDQQIRQAIQQSRIAGAALVHAPTSTTTTRPSVPPSEYAQPQSQSQSSQPIQPQPFATSNVGPYSHTPQTGVGITTGLPLPSSHGSYHTATAAAPFSAYPSSASVISTSSAPTLPHPIAPVSNGPIAPAPAAPVLLTHADHGLPNKYDSNATQIVPPSVAQQEYAAMAVRDAYTNDYPSRPIIEPTPVPAPVPASDPLSTLEPPFDADAAMPSASTHTRPLPPHASSNHYSSTAPAPFTALTAPSTSRDMMGGSNTGDNTARSDSFDQHQLDDERRRREQEEATAAAAADARRIADQRAREEEMHRQQLLEQQQQREQEAARAAAAEEAERARRAKDEADARAAAAAAAAAKATADAAARQKAEAAAAAKAESDKAAAAASSAANSSHAASESSDVDDDLAPRSSGFSSLFGGFGGSSFMGAKKKPIGKSNTPAAAATSAATRPMTAPIAASKPPIPPKKKKAAVDSDDDTSEEDDSELKSAPMPSLTSAMLTKKPLTARGARKPIWQTDLDIEEDDVDVPANNNNNKKPLPEDDEFDF